MLSAKRRNTAAAPGGRAGSRYAPIQCGSNGALVESLLLASIQRDLFTEECLDIFTREVTRLLAEQRRTQRPDLKQARIRLQAVEQEIAHIMTAIKAGILTASTKDALEQAEAERTRLVQTIHGGYKIFDKVASFLPDLVGKFKTLVDDLVALTQYQVDKARGIVRDLVGGQVRLHPTADGVERFLTAELSGDYAGLLRLAAGPKISLVAVTRIERVTRGL